jgi:uncharacterized radical SAM superfamily Fe-S cluster-containing enzyme
MARPDGRLIPFESHNIFYRDEREAMLQTLRAELDQFHAGRADVRRTVPLHPVG